MKRPKPGSEPTPDRPREAKVTIIVRELTSDQIAARDRFWGSYLRKLANIPDGESDHLFAKKD